MGKKKKRAKNAKRVENLRQKAKMFRRVAAHKTKGGTTEDRLLISLAEQMEFQAIQIEMGVENGD